MILGQSPILRAIGVSPASNGFYLHTHKTDSNGFYLHTHTKQKSGTRCQRTSVCKTAIELVRGHQHPISLFSIEIRTVDPLKTMISATASLCNNWGLEKFSTGAKGKKIDFKAAFTKLHKQCFALIKYWKNMNLAGSDCDLLDALAWFHKQADAAQDRPMLSVSLLHAVSD